MSPAAREQRPRLAMVGLRRQQLRGTDGGEGHRPRPRRASSRGPLELGDGDLAHPVGLSVCGGGSERPDAAPPAVLERRPVLPASALAHPVAVVAVEALGVAQEAQAELDEVPNCGIGVRLACRHDEDPRHVVGAVAVLRSRFGRAWRVRTCPARRSCGAGGRTGVAAPRVIPAPLGPASSRSASSRYAAATTGHPRLGASRARLCGHPRRREPGRSGVAVSASTMASGSSWSTMIPAPLASISTACGKAVAITGRPAAMASTSTPEVAWSRES